MPPFDLPGQFANQPISILIRSTNWIGDAIMTLPTVRTIRANFPAARITVLAQPWVADIFSPNPAVDRVLLYHKKGRHAGLRGMWRLSRELAAEKFDLAILLQNAFEAALLARLARIPAIAGFKRDGRGILLSHGVPLTKEIRSRHQVFYYQQLMASLGLTLGEDRLSLPLAAEDREWAATFIAKLPKPIIGLNPGAAYGPAKRWPAERYGEVARRLVQRLGSGSVLVFGTAADSEAAAVIGREVTSSMVDLTGKTTLARAMALIGCCHAFVTNDSGLMHVAAALNTPLVAIFGSTDAVATGPFSERAVVVRKSLPCSPCLKSHCPTNFECMHGISSEEVERAVLGLLGK
jgi:heptosyltransferase-2